MSQQARNKQRLNEWKGKVRRAAEARWPRGAPPTLEAVELWATYFYESSAPDVDNMVKPIQDALAGLVYANDKQVTDAHPRKRDINGNFRIKGISPVLALGFTNGREFIHVVVGRPRLEVIF